MTDSDGTPTPLLEDFDLLLKSPAEAPARLVAAGELRALRVLAGALLAYAVYGGVAGLFAGGAQIGVAAWKAPAIVLFSVVLCTPSLYVFASLAGAQVSGGRLWAVLVGFGAILALLFLGFLPIAWLFSVSSRSLGFMVWLHVGIWLVSVTLTGRFLRSWLGGESLVGIVGPWLVLLSVVSFQVATMLRPVLQPGAESGITGERLFFLEHLGRVHAGPGQKPDAGHPR